MAEALEGLKIGWRYRYLDNVIDIAEGIDEHNWLSTHGNRFGTYRMVELGPTPPPGYDLILDKDSASPKSVETDLMWIGLREVWEKPDCDDGIFYDSNHYCRKIKQKLQVRDGGRYRTREGKVVTMRPDSNHPDYPWRGDDGLSRTDGGQLWQGTSKRPADLVEELPDEQPEAVEEADEPIRIVADGYLVMRGDLEIASVNMHKDGSIRLEDVEGRSVAFCPDEWAAITEAINKLRHQ